MTNPITQRRLMALLTGAIYAIANGLFPMIDTIMQQPSRPWLQRANYANRFSRIIQQLLALTARIRPETLSRNPTFATLPGRTAQPSPAAPQAQQQPAPIRPLGPLRPLRPLGPARLLSALQVARRIAILLRQLEQLVAEIGAALPGTIRRNVARARTLAGCNVLPSQLMPHKSWERAG